MDRDPEQPSEHRARTALIAAGGTVAVLLLVAVVVLLAMTWSELRTSRKNIESQNAKASVLLQATRPALDDVPQLVDDAQPVIRRLAPLLSDLLTAQPKIGDIASRLPLVLSSVQGLANEGIPLLGDLRRSDLPSLVADLNASGLSSLVAELQSGELSSTLESTNDLVTELSTGDRLVQTLDATGALLAEVQSRRLPERAVASSRRLKALLETQRQTFAVLQQSLGIQERLLRRVRSIDEKFGGQVPPTIPVP